MISLILPVNRCILYCLNAYSQQILLMLSVNIMVFDAVHMLCIRKMLFVFLLLSIAIEKKTSQSFTE